MKSTYRAKQKKWYEKTKYNKYGLTQETFDVLSQIQKGLCKICGLPDSRGVPLSVDHCHTTGSVRGLLCHNCNVGLGHFKDNKDLLLRAAEYLK